MNPVRRLAPYRITGRPAHDLSNEFKEKVERRRAQVRQIDEACEALEERKCAAGGCAAKWRCTPSVKLTYCSQSCARANGVNLLKYLFGPQGEHQARKWIHALIPWEGDYSA